MSLMRSRAGTSWRPGTNRWRSAVGSAQKRARAVGLRLHLGRLHLSALAFSLLAAGCGSVAAKPQPPAASSPGALTRVVAASTATAETIATVEMSSTGTPSSVHENGIFDFAHGLGSLTVSRVSSGGRSPVSRKAWTVIFLPKSAYYQPPRKSNWKLSKAKGWISIDLTGKDKLWEQLPQFIPEVESFNPIIGIYELKWGTRAATVEGPAIVDGKRVTQYKVTVNLQSALTKANGPNKMAFLAAIGSQIRPAGGRPTAGDWTRVELQVWLNPRGRLVQMQPASIGRMGIRTILFRTSRASLTVHRPSRSQRVAATSIAPSGERENSSGGDSDGA